MANVEEFEIQEAIESLARKDAKIAGVLAYGQAKGGYAVRLNLLSKETTSKKQLRKKVIIYASIFLILIVGIYFLRPFEPFLFLTMLSTIALSVFAAFDLYDFVKKTGAITLVVVVTFFVLLASNKYTFDELAQFGRDTAKTKIIGEKSSNVEVKPQAVDSLKIYEIIKARMKAD